MDMYERCKERFPKLMSGTIISFGVGKGWEPIVEEACLKLSSLNQDLTIAQVKEKFGDLRIYLWEDTEQSNVIVREAEKQAWATCEFCGSTEEVSTTSGKIRWIKTLCKECHEKRDSGLV